MPWPRISPEAACTVALSLLLLGACGRPQAIPDSEEGQPVAGQIPPFPAVPVAERLLRVDLAPTSTFDYFIDPDSIGLGADGTVRYTLLARSPSGATNVSFEALRCEPRERRLYAVGRADGTWAAVRKSEWMPLTAALANQPHVVLHAYFFCPNRAVVRSSEEAIWALKLGRHPDSAPKP